MCELEPVIPLLLFSYNISKSEVVRQGPLLVIYYLAGHDLVVGNPDTRGRTWEFDFTILPGTVVYHCSNGPLSAGGFNWTVLPRGHKPYSERLHRKLTRETWTDFVSNHPLSRWYLRAFWDTYLNINNVYEMIEKLEEDYDPMKDWVALHGCLTQDISDKRMTSAHFFSNVAVRSMVKWTHQYEMCPGGLGEDECVKNTIIKFGMQMNDGCGYGFAFHK
jgi:hypothetical protein